MKALKLNWYYNTILYITTHTNVFMFIKKLKEIKVETYIKLFSINTPFEYQNSKT